MTWKGNVYWHSQENCFLEDEVSYQFDKIVSAFDIYEQVINLDSLIELLVQQSNFYSQRNGRNFLTNFEKMKALIGFNYIMAVHQLQSRLKYWDSNNFVVNVGIQNIFARERYQDVLQNLYLADNTKQGKTDKVYKIRPIIYHLNESFQTLFLNELFFRGEVSY